MHLSAEHTLFFERRQPLWRAVFSLGVTGCALILNANTNLTISLVGAGVGAFLLLVAYVQGHRRVEPVLAWTLVLVVIAMEQIVVPHLGDGSAWLVPPRVDGLCASRNQAPAKTTYLCVLENRQV